MRTLITLQQFSNSAMLLYAALWCRRRDVWHGTDMAGAGRLRAQWNEALLQLVVAPAYLELLTAAATVLGPGLQFNRYRNFELGRTNSLSSSA